MDESRKTLEDKCKKKLLKMREERLNGLKNLSSALESEITGDEGDMASALENQHTSLVQREKILHELREVESALSRIETGNYGMCEETEEPIETERLLALPWTRLSLAGAEIREAQKKKYAI